MSKALGLLTYLCWWYRHVLSGEFPPENAAGVILPLGILERITQNSNASMC